MDTYIVRIYRRDKKDPKKVAGVVESVGKDGKKGFSGPNALWKILSARRRTPERASPRKREPLPLLAPEHLPGLSAFAQRFFESLFGRLRPGSVLVLDNYQKVPEGSKIHEAIRDGLSRLPAGSNAIVIGRSGPAPAFAGHGSTSRWRSSAGRTCAAPRSPRRPGKPCTPAPAPGCS